MGYYLILGDPMQGNLPYPYKGLYRTQPFPNECSSAEMISLWERYVLHYEKIGPMGITTELSLCELFDLAALSKECTSTPFEVVYFDRMKTCPQAARYYGVDVTGVGGYSLLGEGLFSVSSKAAGGLERRLYEANATFRPLLNQYGLFDQEQDAMRFRTTLEELSVLFPGSLENEAWQTVCVFGLCG